MPSIFHTDSIYILIFGSGLLGGFGHCAGMCGPLAGVLALSARRRYLPHLLYNSGRIISYSLLGGIMGLTGSFVGVIHGIEKLQGIIIVVIGVTMIIMGLTLAGWLNLAGKNKLPTLTTIVPKLSNLFWGMNGTGAFFPLGLLLGFIPCGLLYTAFIAAAGAGAEAGGNIQGMLRGMLMLFLFGLGTAPSLLLVGYAVSVKGEWFRKKFSLLSALLIIVIGLVYIYRGWRG